MDIKKQINDDLKQLLLSGEKDRALMLKNLKAAILSLEIEKHARDSGLDDDQIITLLRKEAKKRRDTANIYAKSGNNDREQSELKEAEMIESYLPEQMSEEQLNEIIDEELGDSKISIKEMGQTIGRLKQKTEGKADGAMIARLVKERVGA